MNELLALQNAVWDVIAVVGVIGGLIVALVLACLFCRREPSTLNPQPSTRFEPGQWVKASREMVWMYGCSVTVPRGAILQLIDRFETSDGPRWSAKWKRIHLHSVPEEFIEPYTASGAGGLPSGVVVQAAFGNWDWVVRDPITERVIEAGVEPTELRAATMAWAAYDRFTESDTAIVENKVATDEPIRPALLDGLFVLIGTMGPDEIAFISPRRRLSQAEMAGLSESLPDNLRGRVVLLEHCDATIRKAVAS